MKVKKGGVVLSIPPSDKLKYTTAGWEVVRALTRKEIAVMNEKAKQKRLAKLAQEGK